MPESAHSDAEILFTAYADRVTEAFRVLAENLSTGQNEQSCVGRFRRSLEMIRRARDLALQAAATPGAAEAEPAQQQRAGQAQSEPLSAEDQALIEQALSGTTGHMPAPPQQRYRR